MARGTRPRKNRVEVWCDDDELACIKTTARAARLSTSEYLRNLGKGQAPKSAFDRDAIRELIELHADQVRLGEIQMLWLKEKNCMGAPAHNVRSLLRDIERLQTDIARLVMKEARRL